jgi:hypothetical protein
MSTKILTDATLILPPCRKLRCNLIRSIYGHAHVLQRVGHCATLETNIKNSKLGLLLIVFRLLKKSPARRLGGFVIIASEARAAMRNSPRRRQNTAAAARMQLAALAGAARARNRRPAGLRARFLRPQECYLGPRYISHFRDPQHKFFWGTKNSS